MDMFDLVSQVPYRFFVYVQLVGKLFAYFCIPDALLTTRIPHWMDEFKAHTAALAIPHGKFD